MVQPLPSDGSSVDAGTYAPKRNRDVVSVAIPECCWKVAADNADILFLEHAGAPGTGSSVGVGIADITVVYTGGCDNAPTRLIGDRPQDLIDWVQSTPQLDASDPRAVIDLGRHGIGIEATVLAPPTGDRCSRTHATLWGVAGGSWGPNIGTHFFLEALDNGSRTLTLVYAAADEAALSYAESLGVPVVDSMVLRN
jgi:hypothetical protein